MFADIDPFDTVPRPCLHGMASIGEDNFVYYQMGPPNHVEEEPVLRVSFLPDDGSNNEDLMELLLTHSEEIGRSLCPWALDIGKRDRLSQFLLFRGHVGALGIEIRPEPLLASGVASFDTQHVPLYEGGAAANAARAKHWWHPHPHLHYQYVEEVEEDHHEDRHEHSHEDPHEEGVRDYCPTNGFSKGKDEGKKGVWTRRARGKRISLKRLRFATGAPVFLQTCFSPADHSEMEACAKAPRGECLEMVEGAWGALNGERVEEEERSAGGEVEEGAGEVAGEGAGEDEVVPYEL